MTGIIYDELPADADRARLAEDDDANLSVANLFPSAGTVSAGEQAAVASFAGLVDANMMQQELAEQLQQEESRLDRCCGCGAMARDAKKWCQAHAVGLVVGALAVSVIVLTSLIVTLILSAKAHGDGDGNDDGNGGGNGDGNDGGKGDGNGGGKPNDLDDIVERWRDQPEDQFWRDLTKWIDEVSPPIGSQTYVVYTLLELTRAEAPWQKKLRDELVDGTVPHKIFEDIRAARKKQLFELAESILDQVLQDYDPAKKKINKQILIDTIDRSLRAASYSPATLNGQPYLAEADNLQMTRREKLLVLHYVDMQILRLQGAAADIVYDLYYTLDTDRYFAADKSLGFSFIKVDDKDLNIVLLPMPVDIDQVAWSMKPPDPAETTTDTSRPFRWIRTSLQDQTNYSVTAKLQFLQSKVMSKHDSSKSWDKSPIEVQSSFTVDNSTA